MESPDPWQKAVLQETFRDWLLCCSRQIGKSTVTGVQAIHEAMCCGQFVLIISASERQAFEFMAKRVFPLYRKFPLVPVAERPTKSEINLINGGRILALPSNEATVLGYSGVGRLIVDEAAKVPDPVYNAVSPVLAVARGRKTLLSTPFGKRGFFYNTFHKGHGWRRQRVPWSECPRLTPEFIERERAEMGQLYVDQSYECKFIDGVSSVFDADAFAALIDQDMETLY